MAILDKLKSVGESVRDKVKETFGEPDTSSLDHDADANADDADAGPASAALDVAGAYAALSVKEDATLADVREAYRALARHHHPAAVRDGDASAAQHKLDTALEALELLEEHLVPLSPSASPNGGPPAKPSAPTSMRKRATARKG